MYIYKYLGVSNQILWFGFFVDIWIMTILAYFKPINIAFGTRDLIFIHFGICGIPFGIYLLVWNEIRKFFVKKTTFIIRYEIIPPLYEECLIGGHVALVYDFDDYLFYVIYPNIVT